MQLSPRVRAILERLGVNTTRLQWKLYQWERRTQARENAPSRLPAALRWMEYPHKFCFHCNAVVPRDERVCPKCGRHVPSMAVYKVRRLLGLVSSGDRAPTIYLFLLAMVAVFLLQIVMQGPSAIFSTSKTSVYFGAWSPALVVLNGDYWRLLSFGLIHGGILHILFNGVALTQVGPSIEDEAGSKRMLVIITVTQLAAALASHFWYVNVQHAPMTTSVGASGWLFGLLGYGIGHYHRGFDRMQRDIFIQWAVYGILFGFLLHANNAAHVGGMVAGILLAVVPSSRRQWERVWNPIWTTAFWISVGLWLITVGYMAQSVVRYWPRGD